MYHTIALTNTNEVFVWGTNEHGELGLGNYNDQNIPIKHQFKNIRKICCGKSHSIILTISGKIYIWGGNFQGQLGIGNNIDQNIPQELELENIRKICCGFFYSMALTNCGNIYVWGSNVYGQLGLGLDYGINQYIPLKNKLLSNIKSIYCGYDHSIAITKTNDIYVWGRNDMGQLGLGDYSDRNIPQKLDLKFTNQIYHKRYNVTYNG